ncbi:hypothetical protein [Streptomyces coeruleorubidus]|uniref:Uncharacterized protein n=1 Tax=Streptomyces coeruleorubidus TaxID=116188 RepID=A0A5J6I116_STRC4|nr:hypothetical protein [Streptomyces coeruleorubidus]QEV25678.1 hypothetical protein CP976_16965 [Streptomyces coeruleorubidus]GGT48782.1 hypothetical protein GCM10010256_01210 [Streptomyces coeruleorubidus]
MDVNYEELRESLTASRGLRTVAMGILRDIEGAGRLGIQVREAISRSLESHGMGHFPGELPSSQHDQVRLYLLGSPIADVVKAVLSPTPKGDEALRSINDAGAQEQLRQIGEIVGG